MAARTDDWAARVVSRAYWGDGVYYYQLALRNSLIGAVVGHFVGQFVRGYRER